MHVVTSVEPQAQRVGDRGDAEVADGARARAEQRGRDVGDDLVDEPGAQEGGRERRSALEEHVLPVAVVQRASASAGSRVSQAHGLGRGR